MVASNSTHKDQGPLGEFALGEFAQGPAFVTEDWAAFSEPVRQKIDPRHAVALIASGLIGTELPEQGSITATWLRWLNEPVRLKPGLPAQEQQYLAYTDSKTQNAPNNNFAEQSQYSKFSFLWSEPVRQKPGLPTTLQQFFTNDTKTFPAGVGMQWFTPLQEPVRVRPRLPEGEQQFLTFYPLPFVNFSYYDWLSEPVRLKPILSTPLQTHGIRPELLPNPTSKGYIIV